MKSLLSIVILFLFSFNSFSQVEFILSSIPENTPDDAVIHIAGDYNGWDPGDPNNILTLNDDNLYSITLNESGTIQFKFTRGDWITVEGDENGQEIANRTYTFSDDSVAYFDVLSWKDIGGVDPDSTAADNVYIMDDDFFMPQLNRSRRIWIYLPLDYESSNKDYPVLYMQDGQNLFENVTSYIGEWEVDESLNEFFQTNENTPIVVGIDNGGGLRVDEYGPWVNSTYGGGEGDEYVDFIVETLKPHIDENYRTKPDRNNTGIMGSSLGAHISLYAGLKYPEVFSKLGLFSSAFWFNEEIFEYAANYIKEFETKMYFIAGALEGDGILDGSQAMYDTLLNNGFSEADMYYFIHSDGQHSEWYWLREFIPAYEWMFADYIAENEIVESKINFEMYPNPANDQLFIKSKKSPTLVEIINITGKIVLQQSITENDPLNISNIKEGIYFVRLRAENAQIVRKLVIQ